MASSKYAQMPMPPPPQMPMDPAMMAQMGGAPGGMPMPPDPNAAVMGPPPAGGVPPPPQMPMDPAMMAQMGGAPGGMPMPPDMNGGMGAGAPSDPNQQLPPGVPEGMDPNASPETMAAAQEEVKDEDLRQEMKHMNSRLRDMEKMIASLEQVMKGVANHIGISTGSSGSGKESDPEDAEKSAALQEIDEETMEKTALLVAAGLRALATANLAEAEGLIERQ